MRLWTLHPRYLDPQGLVALWREALLAKAVLHGQTRGYRHHPQLARFQALPDPRSGINAYLEAVNAEAVVRGYAFDQSKIGPVVARPGPIVTTTGQLDLEWRHLLDKLARRSPALRDRWAAVATPDCHPMFTCVPGPVADWERASLDG